MTMKMALVTKKADLVQQERIGQDHNEGNQRIDKGFCVDNGGIMAGGLAVVDGAAGQQQAQRGKYNGDTEGVGLGVRRHAEGLENGPQTDR